MLKITNTKGTKLTSNSGYLKDIRADGFMIGYDDGEELLTFDLIKEYFLNKEVRITFEQVTRDTLEV
jgi:uncharacterized protein YaaQ